MQGIYEGGVSGTAIAIGGVVAVVIVIAIIAIYHFSGDTVPIIPPKASMITNDYEIVPDNTIIYTGMLDPAKTQFWPAFSQKGTEPGTGIPPEFWESTKLTTLDDCTIRKGLELIDCTIDPMTLPDNQYPGGRSWHIGNCSFVYGGDGICKVGETVGTGVPPPIREYMPETNTDLASDLQCLRDCNNDPNCAFTVYQRTQSLNPSDQSIQGICKHYAKKAYPFRVKMGDPNKNVYTMNLKKTAKPALNAVDQAVKDALQKELDAYNATLGQVTGYTENLGGYYNGCYSGGMIASDNSIYAPLTNWMPAADKNECAKICSGSADCKSFVHDTNYGCILSKYPNMYVLSGTPIGAQLAISNNKIRCGASYYTKK